MSQPIYKLSGVNFSYIENTLHIQHACDILLTNSHCIFIRTRWKFILMYFRRSPFNFNTHKKCELIPNLYPQLFSLHLLITKTFVYLVYPATVRCFVCARIVGVNTFNTKILVYFRGKIKANGADTLHLRSRIIINSSLSLLLFGVSTCSFYTLYTVNIYIFQYSLLTGSLSLGDYLWNYICTARHLCASVTHDTRTWYADN